MVHESNQSHCQQLFSWLRLDEPHEHLRLVKRCLLFHWNRSPCCPGGRPRANHPEERLDDSVSMSGGAESGRATDPFLRADT